MMAAAMIQPALVDAAVINNYPMLYFVKRNIKLKEYKDYYKVLDSACFHLDKLNPDLEKAKSLLLWRPDKEKKKDCLGVYLQKTYDFNYEDFKSLDLTKIGTFKILKDYLVDFKGFLQLLKNYESFQGRIKFNQFSRLFNFENYIYEDKQFPYSIISNYNKRLIPELISACFADMVYENFIGDEIRRNMEQYFISIMSNMDYLNFSHLAQVKQELLGDINDEKNLIYVLGAAPPTFDDEEYVVLLNERI
jgi:hypothetical protein